MSAALSAKSANSCRVSPNVCAARAYSIDSLVPKMVSSVQSTTGCPAHDKQQ